MWIPVAFSALAAIAAALAIVFSDTRGIIASAWVASMSVGALFLYCGAEYLAMLQWIIGTLVAISFLVFATMFGEYGVVDTRPKRQKIFDSIPALLIAGVFFAMIGLTIYHLPARSGAISGPVAPDDLAAMGRALGQRHLVSLELVAFMLLGVLIGAGVISRAEEQPAEGESTK